MDNMADQPMNLESESRGWQKALTQVVAHFCPEHSSDNQANLVANGPHLLEQTTFTRQDLTRPRQFVLMTAPSGVGKGTLGKYLESWGVKRVPRTITRPRRPGERETDYHFVTQAEYDRLLAAGQLLCPTDPTTSATSYAGIEKDIFFAAIKTHQPFYIDSGAGTALQIRQEPELKELSFSVIFILPPTFEEMVRRLQKRIAEEDQLLQAGVAGQTLDQETMVKRLNIAIDHLRQTPQTVDLFVVNDDAERAAKRISQLFGSKG